MLTCIMSQIKHDAFAVNCDMETMCEINAQNTQHHEMEGRHGGKAGSCAAGKHHHLPVTLAACLSRALIWQKQE